MIIRNICISIEKENDTMVDENDNFLKMMCNILTIKTNFSLRRTSK